MPASRAAHDLPVAHPAYLRSLCGLIDAEGGDVALALAQAGLDPSALRDDGPFLSLAQLRWLVLAAQRAAGRPSLAIEAGSRAGQGGHGELSALIATAPDLRALLQGFERFLGLRARWYGVHLEPVPGGLRYRLEPSIPLGDLRQYLLEHALAATCAVWRLLALRLDGVVAELPWPRPAWHAAYARLGVSVRYGATQLSLTLPDALLDRPAPRVDPVAFQQAVLGCEAALAAQHDRPFTRHLQATLSGLPASAWAIAPVASRLGLSSRTVIRRLQAEGTSFQQLVDTQRKQRVLGRLRTPGVSIAEVAREAGFRSASNFARSCRRWFGRSPRQLRLTGPGDSGD